MILRLFLIRMLVFLCSLCFFLALAFAFLSHASAAAAAAARPQPPDKRGCEYSSTITNAWGTFYSCQALTNGKACVQYVLTERGDPWPGCIQGGQTLYVECQLLPLTGEKNVYDLILFHNSILWIPDISVSTSSLAGSLIPPCTGKGV